MLFFLVAAPPVNHTLADGRIESAQVVGDGIKIDVTWMTMTGTTHVAETLAITTDRGTLRFENVDEETGEVIPLVERVFKAAPHRWVMVGWSSFGSGMQTEHAWLLDDTQSLRVVDKLDWTTDRMHAGLALDVGSKVRIGIPLPVPGATDDAAESLHNESEWQLAHGASTFTLARLRKLPKTETHVMALRGFYTPPFQDSPSGRHWSGQFVWFAADVQFALQHK